MWTPRYLWFTLLRKKKVTKSRFSPQSPVSKTAWIASLIFIVQTQGAITRQRSFLRSGKSHELMLVSPVSSPLPPESSETVFLIIHNYEVLIPDTQSVCICQEFSHPAPNQFAPLGDHPRPRRTQARRHSQPAAWAAPNFLTGGGKTSEVFPCLCLGNPSLGSLFFCVHRFPLPPPFSGASTSETEHIKTVNHYLKNLNIQNLHEEYSALLSSREPQEPAARRLSPPTWSTVGPGGDTGEQ